MVSPQCFACVQPKGQKTMTSNTIAYTAPKQPLRWVGVVILHILLGWLLISGTQISALKILRKPMETLLIQDVALLPPTPPQPVVKAPRPYVPPPEVVVADRESSATISVSAQPVPDQPQAKPAAASERPVTPTFPEKVEAALICPGQVRPEIPRQALLNNIQGLVQAQATVQDGQVKDVRILSGPYVFHEAVKTAMRQYRCTAQNSTVVAMQSFNFRFE
jgi:periplasmic protein TonB